MKPITLPENPPLRNPTMGVTSCASHNPMQTHRLLTRFTAAWLISSTFVVAADLGGQAPVGLILSGAYENWATQPPTFVNDVVGWRDFFNAGFLGESTTIANVEAGYIWYDHEVFQRPAGLSSSLTTFTNPVAGSLNQFDFHATTVGHVLAGSGYIAGTDPASYTYAGLGMAPFASLVSAAVATSFSATQTGSFETSPESVITPFKAFFTGIGATRADVINSSWGMQDPTASAVEIVAIDGLARQNPSVAFVASAGNGGSDPVSAPGACFNGIAVGSLGGADFLHPSAFTSSGLVDFYNPATHVTETAVRAAVAIAAPGEQLFLAAYLGGQGSLGAATDPRIAGMVHNPAPTDLYFLNMDGTSYAAPIVAGGIALLKDVAKTHPWLNLNATPEAFDTRVVKSVLMAGAAKTVGWDNGQTVISGVSVTTQSLDPATGAGALDLTGSTAVYYSGTTDVAGTGGGAINQSGWDAGTVNLNAAANDYKFAATFAQDFGLSVSLNWFSVREFNAITGQGEDRGFSNLDLELWQLSDGTFTTLIGRSASLYNNSEFLRFDLLAAGEYGLRVRFNGTLFDLTTNGIQSEAYGLAWRAVAVPEASTATLAAITACCLLGVRRRRDSGSGAACKLQTAIQS